MRLGIATAGQQITEGRVRPERWPPQGVTIRDHCVKQEIGGEIFRENFEWCERFGAALPWEPWETPLPSSTAMTNTRGFQRTLRHVVGLPLKFDDKPRGCKYPVNVVSYAPRSSSMREADRPARP